MIDQGQELPDFHRADDATWFAAPLAPETPPESLGAGNRDWLHEYSLFTVSEALGLPLTIDDPEPLSSLLRVPTLTNP